MKIKLSKLFFTSLTITLSTPAIVTLSSCQSNSNTNNIKSHKPYHSLNQEQSKTFFTKYKEFSFYPDIYFDNYDYNGTKDTYLKKEITNPNFITNPGTKVYNYENDIKQNDLPIWLEDQYKKFGKELDGFPILPPSSDCDRFDLFKNNYQQFFINIDLATYFNDEDIYTINDHFVNQKDLINFINTSQNVLGKLKLSGLFLNDLERQNTVKFLLHPIFWETLLSDEIKENKKINTIDLSSNNLSVVPNFASIVYYDNYKNNITPSNWLLNDSSNQSKSYKLGTIDLRNNKISMLNLNPEVPIAEFNSWKNDFEWYSPGLASIVKEANNTQNNNGLLVDYNRLPWLEHMAWSTEEMDNWDSSNHHILKERSIYRFMKYTSSIHSITNPIESLVQRFLSVGLYQKDEITANQNDLHNYIASTNQEYFENNLYYLSENNQNKYNFDKNIYEYINENHLTSQAIFDLFIPFDLWKLPINNEEKILFKNYWDNEMQNQNKEWYLKYYCPIGFDSNNLSNISWNSNHLTNFDTFGGVYKGAVITLGSLSKKQYFNPNDKPSDPNDVSSWITLLINEFNNTNVYSIQINGFKIDWTGLTINILVYGLLGIILAGLIIYLIIKNIKNRKTNKKQYIRGKE